MRYRVLRFVNEDEDLNKERILFPMVDHEVVVVGIMLTNHTSDDVENDIDHQLLDNEHRQPEKNFIQNKRNTND